MQQGMFNNAISKLYQQASRLATGSDFTSCYPEDHKIRVPKKIIKDLEFDADLRRHIANEIATAINWLKESLKDSNEYTNVPENKS